MRQFVIRQCRKCGKQGRAKDFLLASGRPTRRRRPLCTRCRIDGNRQVRPADRAFLLTRAGGRCAYCDTLLVEYHRWDADHVVPRSLAGAHGVENLVVSCPPCNCVHLPYLTHFVRRAADLSRVPHDRSGVEREVERVRRLGIRTGQTFWERRAYVQDYLRSRSWGRQWFPATPSSYAEVRARVAHLSPTTRGRPRPGTCSK